MKIFPLIAMLLSGVLLLQGSCATRKQMGAGPVQPVQIDAGRRPPTGDHQSALEFYREACSEHPEDGSLRSGYRAALEEAKKAADHAYEKGDYASSGRTYSLVRKHYSSAAASGGGLSFAKQQLDERLCQCRDRLSLEAVQLYRTGNLKSAITVWKDILSFDPDDADARKAVETAAIQLKTLQKER
jgi:tetratricopeptide (TPR) repeat protein